MKIAYSGTHSTGKSYSAYELTVQMKKENPDKSVYALTNTSMYSLLPMNRGVTIDSQLWRFSNQMILEIEACVKNDIVICDRCIVDPIAYTKYLGFEELYFAQCKLAEEFLNTYDKIYYKSLVNNNFEHQDGRRDNDFDFRFAIDNIIHNTLHNLLSKKNLYDRLVII